ncbi:hypothetical protein P154DRAFT_22078 [Amniculicola lignicola CBS 123094]|uniref:Uncharacterized protein n=1 Tax=Amniculicola lignicola CBS 123094 TaxID=1392246 RepID=A0A6A5WXQ0_9PLEO|nr:hypothetical protein P154DRAFT_22078 [Amniculicola lignicola CBS 123094]
MRSKTPIVIFQLPTSAATFDIPFLLMLYVGNYWRGNYSATPSSPICMSCFALAVRSAASTSNFLTAHRKESAAVGHWNIANEQHRGVLSACQSRSPHLGCMKHMHRLTTCNAGLAAGIETEPLSALLHSETPKYR